MKKTFFFITFFLGLTTFAQKIRFSDTGNHWLVQYKDDSGWCDYWFNDYSGDTTINGKSYQKLYTHWTYYSSCDTCSYTFLREDTTTAKIYVLINDTEQVFMDYHFQVGDTLTLKDKSGNITTSFVHSIDSTPINTVYHRLWYFHPVGFSRGFTVIEGIGCTSGPLFPIMPMQGLMYFSLTCFHSNGNTPPISPPIGGAPADFDNSTSCTLAVNALTGSINTLNFNNPVYDDLNITSSGTIHRITIQDMLGRVVYTGKFSTEKASINISALSPGLYFLSINNASPQKLLKQ